MEGEPTAFADSSRGWGLVLTIGRAKFLAKEAMDAKGVGDVVTVAEEPGEVMWDGPSGEGGDMYKSFIGTKGGDGVRGAGGWPSESAHASRAAFSSTLTKGSNSFNGVVDDVCDCRPLVTSSGTAGSDIVGIKDPELWSSKEDIYLRTQKKTGGS